MSQPATPADYREAAKHFRDVPHYAAAFELAADVTEAPIRKFSSEIALSDTEVGQAVLLTFALENGHSIRFLIAPNKARRLAHALQFKADFALIGSE